MLRLLVLVHGANTRLVDADGFTAVHWLANNGRASTNHRTPSLLQRKKCGVSAYYV